MKMALSNQQPVRLGDVFTHWTVIGHAYAVSNRKNAAMRIKCECYCGIQRDVNIASLQRGASRSCGCYRTANSERSMQKLGEIYKSICLSPKWVHWNHFEEFKKWSLYAGYKFAAEFHRRDESGSWNAINCYWDPMRRKPGRKPADSND